MTQPFILLPGEGRLLEQANFEVVVLATSDQTDDAFPLMSAAESG